MAVVKDEKPLWRAGLALSGPVLVVGLSALLMGLANRSLLQSPTLRGLILITMALSVLALGMLLWGIRRGSRRMRRWDVRLSILGNLILLALLTFAALKIRPREATQSDSGAPQSAADGGSGGVAP